MDLPQNKFLRIIETIKEGYFDVDLRGNYLNCNKSLCELIGYSREELLKLNYKQVTDKENQKTVFEIFNSVYRTGKPRTDLLYQFITKSNEKITAEVSVYLKYDSQGNKIGFYGLIRDVTEKTIAKQKLQESEEKYRNFVENAQEGLLAIDENSYIIFVNPKICEMLGYNRDELMGRSVFSLLKLSRSEIIAIFRDQWEKGLIETFELEFIKKDRTVLSTSVNATSITDENGNFKGSFAFINDITMRKLAEQKLKESEERYRNLIESGPFAIVLVNKQGKISYCNPAFEKLSGYPQEELIGYKFKDLSAIYPEDVPIMVNRFQKNLKGEFLPPLEIELYKKDGNVAWISYQSTLVKVGEESLLQIVIEDVTEKRKADLLIKEEIAKLKELEQIRRDLISRVSHELKTPLVSVCGASELLLDIYINEFKSESKELIEMIEKGGKRLKYLVDNLVDTTRIEYGKFKLKKEKTDINHLIKDCIKEMMYLIKQRELNLEHNLMDVLFLEIDKVRIEQVISNLLSNAIKNTPPNGIISINSLKIDDKVKVIIKDTGIGLTKEEMNRIFIRFGKIERYGNGLEYIDIQGTGLGLFISKEIIDLHEGQIWVESEGRDKGSTFIFKLPIN